jgi:DNA primase
MRKEHADAQAIKDRIDIVSVISRYLTLKKAGASYKGHCPFHKDDTPSFIVNAEKGLWHCFGCGEGGDVFAFLMKIEKLSFPEAAERLAAEVGLSLNRREDGEREKLRAINSEAAAYFSANLADSAAGRRGREYLIGRGYEEETWEQFGLGYALPGWENLKKRFVKQYGEKLLLNLGLLVTGKDSSYDRFRDRVIFPIYDLAGQPIAFGGRSFEGEPKYLNSPKTALFDKGYHLYGLSWARDALREQHTAILVEGYTDVLSLHRAGVTHAVGSMGTALTQKQADLLARFAEEVVIVYDRDAAGGAASLRGMQILRNSGLSVRIATLPEGDDPDSLVRRDGAKRFLEIVDKAIPFHLSYLAALKERHDLTTIAGKERALTEARPFYQGITSLPLRQEIANKLSALLELPVEGVIADLATGRMKRKPREEVNKAKERWGPQELILSLLLQKKVEWNKVKDVISIKDFSEQHRPIVEELALEGESFELSSFSLRLDEESKRRVSSLVFAELPFTDIDKALQDALTKLVKRPKIERKLSALREELKEVEKEGDHERLDELQRAYSILVTERLSRRGINGAG